MKEIDTEVKVRGKKLEKNIMMNFVIFNP